MAADDGRALARPPRPHGAIDPVVIFVWDPTGGGKISKCMLISTSPPANPPVQKNRPLFSHTSPRSPRGEKYSRSVWDGSGNGPTHTLVTRGLAGLHFNIPLRQPPHVSLG